MVDSYTLSQKQRSVLRMATQGDVIDRLWLEVINLDARGGWMADCRKLKGKERDLFGASSQALEGLTSKGVEAIDLGRVGRFIRYEAVFGTLYALEDPGPKKGKLAGLHKILAGSDPKKRETWKPEQSLLEAFWEMIAPDDDGEWLRDLTKQKGDRPFDDTGEAVKRLLAQGAQLKDVALVGVWHRYRACAAALEMLEAGGFVEAEEIEGFHELLLGADPSGKEGRPGSWPLKTASKKKPAGAEALLWQVRSGQTIAFSPDSKILAVAGASGPVRFYDANSGKERLVCEGLKSHISHIAFSPDGAGVAIAEMYQRLNVCDAKTGKVVWKARFEDNEVSGLAYSPKTKELIRASWCRVIDVLDAETGRSKEPLRPAASTRMINAITFLNDGNKLAAVWSPKGRREHHRVTIWSWPAREPLVRFGHAAEFVHDVAASSGGKVLAIPNYENGIALYDTASGQMIRQVGAERVYHVVFTPKHNLLIAGMCGKPELCFWEVNSGEERLRIPAQNALEIAISPNGRILAAATSRGAVVWDLERLYQAVNPAGRSARPRTAA